MDAFDGIDKKYFHITIGLKQKKPALLRAFVPRAGVEPARV